MGVGTMRKREVNEGKAYEGDGGEDALMANAAAAAGAKNKKRK